MKALLLLLLVMPIFIKAQNKCKYDVDEYDKFLKISKREKEVKIINNIVFYGDILRLDLCQYDTLRFLRIKYIRTKETNDTVVGTTDDALIFLMEDGSTIKACPDKIYTAHIKYPDYYPQTQNGLLTHHTYSHYVLNATYFFDNFDDMDKLKNQKVTSIRIYYNNVYKEYDLKGKISDNLRNTVQCF